VSLQYTDSKEELDLMDALGYDIKRMDEYVKAKDYNETARLVASCDLVISICTTVVHLAGALGVRCWVMTPKFPAWRYQNTGGMPWYRSVRLYRSPEVSQDGWFPVITRISHDLNELVDSKSLRVA
jgi:ADP-heptose:LPS heptosyltransferase